MRIRRLLKATGCGVFVDFRWPAQLPVLADRVVIYGWNGSGKTTLASIFRELEIRRRLFPNGEYEFETDSGRIRSEQVTTGMSPLPIRVFDTDFVAETVFTSVGELPPVLYLGKESVEKQQRLDKCRGLLVDVDERLSKLAGSLDETTHQLDRFRTDQGKLVKEALRSSGNNPYNNYDKASYRSKVDALRGTRAVPTKLTEPERDAMRAAKDASRLPVVLEVDRDIQLSADFDGRLKTVLGLSIQSQALPRLTSDPEVGQWVEVGVQLHRDRETRACLFCEIDLSPGTLERFERHFNQAFKALVADIESLLLEVETVDRAAAAVALPVSVELSPPLRPEFDAALHGFEGERAAFVRGLEAIEALLRRKRAAPFTVIEDVPPPTQSLRSGLEGINKLIEMHNKDQEDSAARIASAKAGLEEDLIAQSWPRLVKLEDRLAALEIEKGSEEGIRATLVSEIADLEREITEHRPAADELTSELASFLGRGDITFEVSGGGYTIQRQGATAEGLSEGEKSAIALLYFLKTLQHKDFSPETGVVVIDDPVSSLDSNALFCALGYLQAKAENVGQLIFLTHNFAFFRELRKWLSPKNAKPAHPCELYFLSCSSSSGTRRAELAPLDKLLRDYDSEYQYLFKLVWEASRGTESSDLERLYHYPNVARRLLEAFFAFRMPDVHGGLRGRLKQTNLDPAKRERLLRFLDAQSHTGGVDIPEEDLSSLAEVPAVLSDVLDLMQREDDRHFSRMLGLVEARQESP